MCVLLAFNVEKIIPPAQKEQEHITDEEQKKDMVEGLKDEEEMKATNIFSRFCFILNFYFNRFKCRREYFLSIFNIVLMQDVTMAVDEEEIKVSKQKWGAFISR